MIVKGTKPHLRTDSAAMKRAPAVPKWLSADAKREWKRILPDLIERRILTDADLGSLENYCIAIGQVREMERILQTEGHVYGAESGLLKRHPAGVILSDADLSITQAEGRTGLNGIQLTATWFANFNRVEVYGLSGSGFVASLRTDIHPTISDYYQGFQVNIHQCFIHDNAGWGVKFNAGQSPGIYSLQNSYVIYNAGGGILSTTGQCRIVGNAITANGTNTLNGGLLFDTAEGASYLADVRQNEFDSNHGYHIWLKRVRDGNFAQNRFLSNTFANATTWEHQSGSSFMRPGAHVLLGLNAQNEVYNTKFERNYHRSVTGAGPTTAPIYAYIHYAGSGQNNRLVNNDLFGADGVTQNSSGLIKFHGFGSETVIIDP